MLTVQIQANESVSANRICHLNTSRLPEAVVSENKSVCPRGSVANPNHQLNTSMQGQKDSPMGVKEKTSKLKGVSSMDLICLASFMQV